MKKILHNLQYVILIPPWREKNLRIGNYTKFRDVSVGFPSSSWQIQYDNSSFYKDFLKKTSLLLLFLSIVFISCGKQSPEEVVLKGKTMGTTYSVKYVNPAKSVSPVQIHTEIDSVLKHVNMEMSTYIPNSEISRFNTFNKTDWFPVSKDFVIVLRQAKYVAKISDGYFDPTIMPLVNLWGFGPEKRNEKIPTRAEIDSAKKLVNFTLIDEKIDTPEIRKKLPEVYLDFSSIAKGYGVDKVGDFLESKGIVNYLVEIGGELRAHGVKADSSIWRVGVVNPNEEGISIALKLHDLSIATSGDYMNYFEVNGKRYSHTINPKTGRPITHNLASVSVVDPSCMIADAYATAFDVLGPEKGFALSESLDIPVYMIVRKGNKFEVKMNSEFKKLLEEK